MKLRLPKATPWTAFLAIGALALLANVVTGREAPSKPPEVVASIEKRAADPGPSPDLDLERLARRRERGEIQDVFASPAPPAPAAAQPSVLALEKPEPPPVPKAPPLPYSYLGKMKKGPQTIVYLLKQQEMLLVEAGQTVDTDYRIESVSDAAVDFLYLPLGIRQSLPIPPPPK